MVRRVKVGRRVVKRERKEPERKMLRIFKKMMVVLLLLQRRRKQAKRPQMTKESVS